MQIHLAQDNSALWVQGTPVTAGFSDSLYPAQNAPWDENLIKMSPLPNFPSQTECRQSPSNTLYYWYPAQDPKETLGNVTMDPSIRLAVGSSDLLTDSSIHCTQFRKKKCAFTKYLKHSKLHQSIAVTPLFGFTFRG